MSDLTDNQWKTAHAIARYIVQNGANAGELKKAMAYLRTCADESDGGTRFFKYLGNLVGGGVTESQFQLLAWNDLSVAGMLIPGSVFRFDDPG
ncbi:MAG: hypothetical protein ACKO24_07180 [Leptolyngbyaceae cyanobacterium]